MLSQGQNGDETKRDLTLTSSFFIAVKTCSSLTFGNSSTPLSPVKRGKLETD